jgi:hypothetical protein
MLDEIKKGLSVIGQVCIAMKEINCMAVHYYCSMPSMNCGAPYRAASYLRLTAALKDSKKQFNFNSNLHLLTTTISYSITL